MNQGCGFYCAGCQKVKLKDTEYLCPSCREALEVGKLVMRMQRRTFLYRGDIEWELITPGSEACACDCDSESVYGKTALEALKKGVGE